MSSSKLMGGLFYCQLQNSKTAKNYKTKLRIPILYVKREDLG
jgi:hypothetical protein